MTDYTRVTIQGEGRKADLVLPDDEPIAAVLPDVLSLLDESTERSARPVVLMTTVGEQLSPSLTLAEQDVEHGSILRLVRVDEAPPPPRSPMSPTSWAKPCRPGPTPGDRCGAPSPPRPSRDSPD